MAEVAKLDGEPSSPRKGDKGKKGDKLKSQSSPNVTAKSGAFVNRFVSLELTRVEPNDKKDKSGRAFATSHSKSRRLKYAFHSVILSSFSFLGARART
jgi:hypothetical protein